MFQIALIGIGGFVGSVLRYLASGWVQQALNSSDFPFGTLFVNLAGCLTIGVLSQLAESRGLFTPESRALVFIGFLGGFTTFSTFGNETFNLLRDGETLRSFANISATLLLCLGAVWIGRAAAQLIWR